jgi:hypothetical protein
MAPGAGAESPVEGTGRPLNLTYRLRWPFGWQDAFPLNCSNESQCFNQGKRSLMIGPGFSSVGLAPGFSQYRQIIGIPPTGEAAVFEDQRR